ncbi:MAG: FAD-binding oxidoreductase [Rhodobacteraceae bacterium]|nr:MAG: FAD-binding oxidoreductase [Paracoccaceae bacterium]
MALNEPDTALLDALRARLGPAGWRDPADAPAMLEEPRGRWRGKAALVLRPASVDEVSAVVGMAAEARVGVVPYGGGTGLVGGQVMTEGPAPLLLSLERMNAIRRLDPAEDAAVVEAGCVLADVQAAAAEADRLFPLSLASEGSARIGGLLSTNAGGVNVLRYGNARDLCLGIEAVLPDGSILRGLKTLRKDNTGYDLRHLLIGAEGTLGVITAAALKLFPRPRERATAFCAVASPAAAGAMLRALRDRLGETVSAFELMSETGMAFLAAHCPDTPRPPVEGRWFALVEAAGGEGAHVAEALEAGLAQSFEAGFCTDAAIAQSDAQRAAFWRIREDMPVANRRVGAISNHDISTPLSAVPVFVEQAGAAVRALDPAFRVNCFGHIGDGNLHYNVFPPEGRSAADYAAQRDLVKRTIHDLTHGLGGSVSAEHGVGRLKTEDLRRYGDPAKIAAMRAIKAALDPAGIMNPGAVIPL